jgi:hypothetical protein
MDRRENLKLLLSGTLATGFLLSTGCQDEDQTPLDDTLSYSGYGRTPEEIEVDSKLKSETFFSDKEMVMIAMLADIIIPADGVSGSATDAGVPDFIEFMVKDYPRFQRPLRGGLMWLNNLSLKSYSRNFVDLNPEQHIELIDRIAWPDKAEEDMIYGVKFFNLMRNLTATGFFTSEMGVKDIGYQGNRPNQWDGVPQEVLDQYGLSYDEKTLEVCLKIEDQHTIAQWDEEGNLIG